MTYSQIPSYLSAVRVHATCWVSIMTCTVSRSAFCRNTVMTTPISKSRFSRIFLYSVISPCCPQQAISAAETGQEGHSHFYSLNQKHPNVIPLVGDVKEIFELSHLQKIGRWDNSNTHKVEFTGSRFHSFYGGCKTLSVLSKSFLLLYALLFMVFSAIFIFCIYIFSKRESTLATAFYLISLSN